MTSTNGSAPGATGTGPSGHPEPRFGGPTPGATSSDGPPVTRQLPDIVEPDSIRWRTSPVDRRGVLVVVLAFAGLTGLFTALGFAVVEWWDTSAAGDADADLNRWLEDARSERLTTVAEYVSHTSDTLTKVLLGAALVPVMLWLFRRWHEWAIVFGGLMLEVCVFGLSSSLVGRERPPVEQLDGAPTDSFPSGHIAATTVFWVGLAVVIFLRTTRRGPRLVGVVLAVVMPVAMTAARMYLGMHYLTDAVAGIVLGLVALSTVRWAVLRTLPPEERPLAHDRAGERVRTTDVTVGASVG